MPKIQIKQFQQDPHSKRILKAIDLWGKHIPEEAIIRARRAYFGACTYVDNQVGKLLNVLKKCRLDQNTVIIFGGDHGDMLGERGLWYKMSWHEMSARVPLIINYPCLFAPRKVDESVSTMDLLPTMVDLGGGQLPKGLELDGRSLYPMLIGLAGHDEVIGEYMGEGTTSPLVMIRRGPWKFVTSLFDRPQLFNLHNDPHELQDLAYSSDPPVAAAFASFSEEARQRWDLRRIANEVLRSQRQRRFCWSALTAGRFESWDYEPPAEAKTKYIRSNIPLDDLELKARYPPVDALGRESISASPHGAAGAKGE